MEVTKPIKVGNVWTNLISGTTGESVNFEEVAEWHDGTPMDDSKCDGVIYRKLGNEYFVDTEFNTTKTVSVKKFGAKCDGVTDDRNAIQRAVNACPERATLIIPDKVLVSSSITINKPLTVIGGRYDKTHNGPIFNVVGTFSAPILVNSITTDGFQDILNVDNSSEYTKGDVVKIIAEDRFTNRRSNTPKLGEFAVVDSVGTGTITLTKNLIYKDQLVTNVRVAKLDYKPIILQDMIFETAGRTGMNIILQGLHSPILRDISCTSSESQFLEIRSCYGARIQSLDIQNLRDDQNAGAYGYAINELSGYGTQIADCVFRNTRHAFTTNARNPATTVDFIDYGESMDVTVSGCKAFGNSGTSFDTHENGYNIGFINCHSYEGKGAGFQIRNDKAFILNCTSTDRYGLALRNFNSTNALNNVVVDGFIGENYNWSLFALKENVSDNRSSNITIRNSYFKTRDDSIEPIRLENIDVRMDDCTVEGGSLISFRIDQSILDINRTCIYNRNITNNADIVFQLRYNSNVISKDCSLHSATVKNAFIVGGFDIPGFNINTYRVENFVMNTTTTTVLSTVGGAFLSRGAISFRYEDDTRSSKVIDITGDNIQLPVYQILDQNTVFRVNATAISNLTAPYRSDQIITIFNNGANNIDAPANVTPATTLTPGSSVQLMYVSGSWIVINLYTN